MTPGKAVRAKRLESDVVRAGLQLLAYLKIFCVRVNVGMIPNGRGGFRRSMMSGFPDVLAVVDGVALFLEAKSETGRLSESQMAFRDKVERAGAVYAVFRCNEDVSRAVDQARARARG